MEAEDFFKESVARLRDRQLASYSKQPPVHIFSKSFEKEMQELIAKQRRTELGASAKYIWRQAACFTFAGLLGLSLCFVSVGAWSRDFLRMVEQEGDGKTDIRFARTGEGTPQTSDIQYTLTDVPQGYRRTGHTSIPGGAGDYMIYENDAGKRIIFHQMSAEGVGISLNTEGAELEQLECRGHPARFLENDGMCSLLWYDDKYVYMLTTDLPRDETLALAEKITLKVLPYPTLQKLPLELLPGYYPPEIARENGDVVISGNEIFHLEQVEAFVTGCTNSQDGAIRIVHYAPDNSALIDDLQMENNHIYYTRDQSRWKQSETSFEEGEEYDSIGIVTNGEEQVLTLYSRHYDAPVEVIRFQKAPASPSSGK